MVLLGAVGVVSGLLLAAARAAADPLPAFDITAHCHRVGTAADRSLSIEVLCRQQEEAAMHVLSTLSLASPIGRYCLSLAEAAGGSYDIMLGCIGQEEAAARRVNETPAGKEVRARCADIAAIAGGSNVIMLDCIEDAQGAKASP